MFKEIKLEILDMEQEGVFNPVTGEENIIEEQETYVGNRDFCVRMGFKLNCIHINDSGYIPESLDNLIESYDYFSTKPEEERIRFQENSVYEISDSRRTFMVEHKNLAKFFDISGESEV